VKPLAAQVKRNENLIHDIASGGKPATNADKYAFRASQERHNRGLEGP